MVISFVKKKKKKKYKPKAGQYQMEAGIKQFGEQGKIAVTKELDQFNKYKVFELKHAYDLSKEDRKKALSSLNQPHSNSAGFQNNDVSRSSRVPEMGMTNIYNTIAGSRMSILFDGTGPKKYDVSRSSRVPEMRTTKIYV